MPGSSSTRYGESRTLVRGLCRLPGQTRAEFRQNVARLRRQFEQFNLDASEICQWLMGFRPGGKRGDDATKAFWDFFLEPATILNDEDKEEGDSLRRKAFELIAGYGDTESLSGYSIPSTVLESARAVAGLPLTPSAEKLFKRLREYADSHREVLLKATAGWVVSHYWRGMQNWERHHEEWEKEKVAWEKANPQLTEEARNGFNAIFRELGIREKRARLCTWERLKELRDDCEFAGERIGRNNHAPLCVKFKQFHEKYGRKQDGKNFKNYFVKNAKQYLENKRTGKKLTLKEQLRQKWFPSAWREYLKAIEVNESTILTQYKGRLPHCTKFGADIKCEHNKHTHLCNLYRGLLAERTDLQGLEEPYREWRRRYLSGPKKPSFRYPSSRSLPMPKIFGKNFYRADFNRSFLDLRLESMAQGEFRSFGFKPWPVDYTPQPEDAAVTSVHINFIGTRARVGFHFSTPHRASRFTMTQDEIDELRSRVYPRYAQDQKFLDEARKRLIESFQGNPAELRLMAVDMGETGASIAFFEGKTFRESQPLKIVKINKLMEARPKVDKTKPVEEREKEKRKGLGKTHLALHLERWSEGAARIAAKTPQTPELSDHDMRRLALHIRWMIRDWVRLNAARIIKVAEEKSADVIVFESLRGFKAPGYDKLQSEKKLWLAFFAYGDVRRKVKEKAVERGIRVVTVPYLKSSQFCADCGKEQIDKKRWSSNKKRRKFSCEHCKSEKNSDENAARVLGRVFWGEIVLPVSLDSTASGG